MKPNRLSFFALASLLLLLNACNSGTPSRPVHTSDAAPTTAPATYAEADRLHDALYYLASDELEGRGLTTEGINKAADYIARNFKEAGLQPLPGLDGYFQPFETTISTQISDETVLRIGDTSLKLKSDFTPISLSGEGAFEGPIAFVGYGISSDKYGYDDYAGIDVKGKIVLAMRFEPHDENGDSRLDKHGWTEQAALTAKEQAAVDHGAVALILVNPAQYHGKDRLMAFSRRAGESGSIPILMITVAQANELLTAAGRNDLKTLQAAIDMSGKPQSFPMGNTNIEGLVKIDRVQTTIKNVVGYIPGSGARKNEYVVVGAHYDHLGRGERGSMSRSKEIHNGADDNGSGTVAVIELARKMAHSAHERSIIFIAFTGEERGLLGSEYFVKHSPVPLQEIVAMVNLDMVGRVRDNVLFVGGTGTAAEFDSIIAEADGRSSLIVKTAGADVGGPGGIGPSDHESFALKKIPVIFLYSGMHIDYHRPTDDANKINYLGVAAVVDLTADLLDQLCRAPRAQYVDKFDKSFGSMGGSNVQFGIMPDYNADGSTPGIRVAGTVPDTAAARAGVKEGDIIISFGDRKVTGLGDFMTELSKRKPGDQIKVVILRDNQELQLDATLTERRGG